MNTRTIRLNRLTAAAAATLITVVSAWAFVDSTASMARDALAHEDRQAAEVSDYTLPDLLAPPPPCLRGCA